MTRISHKRHHKRDQHEAEVQREERASHHPAGRHPLTVGRLHWYMPAAGVVLGLFVGLGVLLTVEAKQPAPLMFWLGHARVASPGQHVRGDLYDISASGPRVAKPDPAFTPAKSDDIVAVTLTIKNNDLLKHGLYPSIQTYVRDEEGDTYTMHPSLDIKNPLPATDLDRGDTATGEISFELPKRLHKFWLYVDPHWDDMAPVVFTLER